MPPGGTTPERGRGLATTRQQSGAAAAIDIGTNSVLLLIAARDEATGAARPLLERATITRLGEGVDKTHQLAASAIQRTLECLRGYATDLRAYGVSRLGAVGTSALRDTAGGEAFLNDAEEILGQRPRVIAGEEEATLTFRGALSGLKLSGDLLVFDIGGGSTELIAGSASAGNAPSSRVSLDIGSVRLFERHVRSDPPTVRELGAIEADVARELATAAPLALTRAQRRPSLVGVAGTVTTLKAMELGLAPYDGARVHGAVLTLSAVEALSAKLASLPLSARKQLPGLEPQRADVIIAGAIIARDLLRRANATEMLVSDRGVRFGLIEDLLATPSRNPPQCML